MRRSPATPPFLGPDGEPLPGSIAEARYLRLGGVDQWVLVRGESLANPPLILLHGGPGLSETFLFRHFNAALERSFTVVYWDQRGAGKSFDPAIPRSSMTVERFVADLAELVDAVRGRLGSDRVVILGHSWGSVLGPLYVARFPERVAAYVGSAQIGDWAASEAASYAFALGAAQRAGNRRALRKLRAIGPPPHTAARMWTERIWLQRLDGQLGPKALWDMARALHDVPETSVREMPGLMRAPRWTLDAMWPEVSRIDLIERVPAMPVPVFFLLGRLDRWVPPETSVAYFDALDAPEKRLVWFDRSRHEQFADEPGKFNRAMVELVRPAAVAATERAASAARASVAGEPLRARA